MVGHTMSETQHCRFIIFGTALFLLSANKVSAEDFPQTGAVYNTQDVRELTYKCKQIDETGRLQELSATRLLN
jgi:hypothetical protein